MENAYCRFLPAISFPAIFWLLRIPPSSSAQFCRVAKPFRILVHSTGAENAIGIGLGNDIVQIVGDDNDIYASDHDDNIRLRGDRNFLDAGEGTDSVSVDGNDNEIADPD